jgi:hypothetical protein
VERELAKYLFYLIKNANYVDEEKEKNFAPAVLKNMN